LDTTTLAVTGAGAFKWRGITYASSAATLFAAPYTADAALTVRFTVDRRVVAPFRQITTLTNQLSRTQNELSSAQLSMQATVASSAAALASLQASLSSSEAAQSAMRAELSTVSNTVCNRPVCAPGTRPENGSCVPDCTDLERRGLSCEPHCDATDATPGSSPASPAGLIVGFVLGGAIAVAVAVMVYRRRAMHRESLAQQPPQRQAMAMYVNPLHTGSAVTAAVPNEAFVPGSSAVVGGSGVAVLDDELYVAQPASDVAGDYAVFQSGQVENPPQYHVFRDLHPTAAVHGDETA
jgi:hypothetical protein